MQKFVEGGAKIPFCRFHGIVKVKTFFLEINILRAKSADLFVAVTSIMAGIDISRFPGVRIGT